ncbi:C6 transcription factor [Fusarium acutatum]|uniref:C6 transcription factor n=1 Tax=Fusarium acutatum TaxID=78861 RepID=A0A8H4K323_9HYPO|nr:C6 transcription factor [Fusarium acutatum]
MARPRLFTLPYEVRDKIFQEYFSVEGGFFGQLSAEQRRQLRGITLIEDAYAVCSPSAHAMGLIQFCKGNPMLKIERHLKLCRRAPAALSPYRVSYGYTTLSRIDPLRNTGEERLFFENAVSGTSIWLEEAVSLQDAGMPRHSFTLCLDGEPDKAFFSDIFQKIVLRNDASMQISQRLYEMRPHQFRGEPPFCPHRRDRHSKVLKYLTDQHSAAGSINGDPLIRSNFHPGQPLDVEQLVNERLDWNKHDWHMKHCGNTFQLEEYPPTFGRWYDNFMAY